MVVIIDYGMGNLHSVSKAVERLGYAYKVTDDLETIRQAEQVILPGVGAFGDAMAQLRQTGIDAVIHEVVENGTPLLGICLGMQLLFVSSEEGGTHEGLGLLQGHGKKLPAMAAHGERLKVPHIGWNQLEIRQADHPVLNKIDKGYTYFVHSYYIADMKEEERIADATYGLSVPGIVGRAHIVGMQFHPEKSGPTGMKLLENFLKYIKSKKKERV